MGERIKQIRKKKSNGYSSYPIGSDGQYVDMSSGLDLEEELKLGGNHQVEIVENKEENKTQIVEYYLDNSAEESIVYTVKTTIQSAGPIKLLVGQQVDQNQEFLQYNYLAVNGNISISVGLSEQEKITSELFKGYSKIHAKTIDFNQLNTKTTITEEVTTI